MKDNQFLQNYLACPVDNGALMFNENSVQCATCKKIFPVEDGIFCLLPDMSPETAHAYHEQKGRDEEAHIYDKNVGLKLLTSFEYNHYMPPLQHKNGKEEPVLEIACGTGRFTLLMAPHFPHMFSLDVSIESLRVLKRKLKGTPLENKVTMVHGDAAHLPFAAGSFQKASCFQMFQHIPSQSIRMKTLEETHRVLKPGGTLALSAYRDHPITTTIFKKEGTHPNGSYFYRFTKHELEYLLDGYFDVKEIKPLPLFYVWLATCAKEA